MSVSLYFNANCPDCVRQAAFANRLDWLNRVQLRTDKSPLGDVPAGEIVVVEESSNRIFTGVFALRKLCLQIPLYYLYGVVLYLPIVRNVVGHKKMGCNGNACEI